MRIAVLGANFKSCKIAVREAIARACQRRFSTINPDAARLCSVTLSTCNRIEIYFSAPDLAEAHSEILQMLKEEIDLPFEHHLYSYFGLDCFLHLAEVTAGLDSAIAFESEIQRQVKLSYERAASSYPLPSCIHYLFQKGLKLGKHARFHLSLSSHGVTIPKVLLDMAEEVDSNAKKQPLLFVGNSEINRQIIRFLKYKGYEHMTLCSRSLWKKEDTLENIYSLEWNQLNRWKEFRWVICGSNVSSYLIEASCEVHRNNLKNWESDKEDLRNFSLERENIVRRQGSSEEKNCGGKPTLSETNSSSCFGIIKTRFVCDLSVPRAINPHSFVGTEVVHCDMEAIIQRVEKKQKISQVAMDQAKDVICERVDFYLNAFLAKQSSALCV